MPTIVTYPTSCLVVSIPGMMELSLDMAMQDKPDHKFTGMLSPVLTQIKACVL